MSSDSLPGIAIFNGNREASVEVLVSCGLVDTQDLARAPLTLISSPAGTVSTPASFCFDTARVAEATVVVLVWLRDRDAL